MEKIRIIAWDLYGNANLWMENSLDPERYELIRLISENWPERSKVEQTLKSVPDWDYLLVFALEEARSASNDILQGLGIKEEKVIWAFEILSICGHPEFSVCLLDQGLKD